LHDDCVLFEQERDAQAGDDVEILHALQSRPEYVEGDPAARAARDRVYFRSTLRSPALLDRLMENMRVGSTKQGIITAGAVGERLWNATYEQADYNLLPHLSQLRIPTLIVHGDYDFIPLACATHIAEAIPGARLTVLRDCGHFSYLERPDAVRTALEEFVLANQGFQPS
jgi:pimeloyl-ACP methyl ester carboxylesterase